MKWFWLTGHDVRVNLFLLHDYNIKDGSLVLLPRFAAVDRCRGCGKFNEQQLLAVGFDLDRTFRLPTDILPEPNDFSLTIVSEHFRDVCIGNNINGVEFIPCGRRKSGGLLYLLWAVHRSPCHEPVENWIRGNPLKPGQAPFYTCNYCGRPDHVVGFPHRTALDFPDDLVISIPSVPTESLAGVTFRFFCSDTVRQIFKLEKIKGCCFSEMERMEKRSAHHQAVRSEIEARKASESRHEESS